MNYFEGNSGITSGTHRLHVLSGNTQNFFTLFARCLCGKHETFNALRSVDGW